MALTCPKSLDGPVRLRLQRHATKPNIEVDGRETGEAYQKQGM